MWHLSIPFPNQLLSTKLLERHRTHVVAIVPERRSEIRFIGAILLEQKGEWATRRSRNMSLEKPTEISVS